MLLAESRYIKRPIGPRRNAYDKGKKNMGIDFEYFKVYIVGSFVSLVYLGLLVGASLPGW